MCNPVRVYINSSIREYRTQFDMKTVREASVLVHRTLEVAVSFEDGTGPSVRITADPLLPEAFDSCLWAFDISTSEIEIALGLRS